MGKGEINYIPLASVFLGFRKRGPDTPKRVAGAKKTPAEGKTKKQKTKTRFPPGLGVLRGKIPLEISQKNPPMTLLKKEEKFWGPEAKALNPKKRAAPGGTGGNSQGFHGVFWGCRPKGWGASREGREPSTPGRFIRKFSLHMTWNYVWFVKNRGTISLNFGNIYDIKVKYIFTPPVQP